MTTYVLYCGVLITFEEYKEIISNNQLLIRALET